MTYFSRARAPLTFAAMLRPTTITLAHTLYLHYLVFFFLSLSPPPPSPLCFSTALVVGLWRRIIWRFFAFGRFVFGGMPCIFSCHMVRGAFCRQNVAHAGNRRGCARRRRAWFVAGGGGGERAALFRGRGDVALRMARNLPRPPPLNVHASRPHPLLVYTPASLLLSRYDQFSSLACMAA